MYNVLIVDDDESILKVLSSSVNWSNHGVDNVYTVQNTQNARDIMTSNFVDLVICDIEMPMETGFGLLTWIRENNYDCEFLFLTCHEDFSFAKKAISMNAFAYLTKPFDLDTIEFNLHKVLTVIDEKRKNKSFNIDKNFSLLKLKFLNELISGEINEIDLVKNSIRNKGIDFSVENKYFLLYSRITVNNEDIRKFGKSLLEYTLERFHFEVLHKEEVNTSVVKIKNGTFIDFVTLFSEKEVSEGREQILSLISNINDYFTSTITCCLSDEINILQVNEKVQKLEKLVYNDLSRAGTLFSESDILETNKDEKQILNIEELKVLIRERDTLSTLNFIKINMKNLLIQRRLSNHTLFLIQQEVMQVVYSDLLNKGIQASQLFSDELSKELSEHSVDSTMDMIKWIKYMLEYIIDYEKNLKESTSLIFKINDFIHANYSQDIDRNEVAKEFYLTPEYLAKLYKKETGISIKSYINEYRINIAKNKLLETELSVSEIAEAVGFFNFSYFSTIFKKSVGVSPNEYRVMKG